MTIRRRFSGHVLSGSLVKRAQTGLVLVLDL
jgi:hypothetical protein